MSSKLRSVSLRKAMSDPAVNLKKQATSLRNFGTLHPRQNIEHANRHSKTLSSAKVQNKRKATCLANWGVDHPSKHHEVLTRILTTAFSVKKIRVQGKEYTCQGYEPFVLERLAKTFGVKNVVGQFDIGFKPIRLADTWYTPDFYVKEKETYVEVKSLWTLGVRARSDFLVRNRQKQRECNAEGIALKFIVYIKERDTCVQLPKDWHIWDTSKLKQFLAYAH
jgi:hypothetical protein